MGDKRKAEAPPEGSRRSERLQTVKRQKIADEETTSHAIPAKPKRFHRPRQRKSCHLLNLPGEIRNRIYRYALVKAKPIKVTRKGPGEPSLLRVCNRIRREACSIYYAENEFEVHVEDFDGEALVPFKNQYSSFYNWLNGQRRGVNVTNLMKGKPDWDNLVAWAKADRYRTAFWPDIFGAYCPTHQVVASTFKIVDSMDGLPWCEVEQALDAMREVLDGCHLRGQNSQDGTERGDGRRMGIRGTQRETTWLAFALAFQTSEESRVSLHFDEVSICVGRI